MTDLALGALLAAFAGYALARAMTTDSLVAVYRERLETWAYVDRLDHSKGWQLVLRDGRPIWWLTVARGKFADLVTCSQCLGFWLAFAAYCAVAVTWPWDLGWSGWVAATAAGGAQKFLVAVDGRDA